MRMWSSNVRMHRGPCQSGGMRTLIGVVLMLSLISLMPSCTTALILNFTSRGCSKHCQSLNCDNPHTLRFGKFCGVGYTGCPNQNPCDRLDACCRQHDLCVGTNPANFPNHTCRGNLKNCVQQYLTTGAPVFHGSNCTAMYVQSTIMVALDDTTFPLPPGSAPQAGQAAVNSAFLLHSVGPILGLSCFCASVLSLVMTRHVVI